MHIRHTVYVEVRTKGNICRRGSRLQPAPRRWATALHRPSSAAFSVCLSVGSPYSPQASQQSVSTVNAPGSSVLLVSIMWKVLARNSPEALASTVAEHSVAISQVRIRSPKRSSVYDLCSEKYFFFPCFGQGFPRFRLHSFVYSHRTGNPPSKSRQLVTVMMMTQRNLSRCERLRLIARISGFV